MTHQTPTLDRLAELVGRAPTEVREAMFLAAQERGEIPKSGVINIHARVPVPGVKRGHVRPGSMIHGTAKHLRISPEELQEALVRLRPDARPGTSATFGMRAFTSLQALVMQRFQDALDAAYFGNQWAVNWLELARRIIHDLPDDEAH